MELFNETKNNYYLKLIKLINMIMSSETTVTDSTGEERNAVPESDMNSLFEAEGEQDLYCDKILKNYWSRDTKGKEVKLIMETINELNSGKQGRFVYPYYNGSISILPTRAELVWLKTALNDYRAKNFFTAKELENLKSAVDNLNSDKPFDEYCVLKHEEISGEDIDEYNPSDNAVSNSYSSKLHLILKCIHADRKLKYSYNGGKGKKTRIDNDIAVPYKIEYSVAKDELKLSLKSESRKRPVKGLIKKYNGLEALDHNTEAHELKKLVEERKSHEPLKILVRKNADSDTLKRILAMFAKYDRKVINNEDGSYSIEVVYYSFQETDLINDIISFGPQLVIESPEDLRDKMIDKIKLSDW